MNKKMIAAIAAVIVVVLVVLVVGSKKKTVSFSVPEMGECELVEIPEGTDSCSVNNGVVTVTLKKEGDYTIKLRGEDGVEHTVTIKYHGNTVEGSTDAGLSLVIGS